MNEGVLQSELEDIFVGQSVAARSDGLCHGNSDFH